MNKKYPQAKNVEICVSDFSKGIDSLTHENTLNQDYAVSSYNFSYKNGGLTEGCGFEPLKINYSSFSNTVNEPTYSSDVNFLKVWYFKRWDNNNQIRRDNIMAWASDNNVYYVPLFSIAPEVINTQMSFTDEPQSLNYKLNDIDYNISISQNTGMCIWDGSNSPYIYDTTPDIRSFCASNGRFYASFGGDRNVIRYTTNEDLTTWYVTLGAQDTEIELKDDLGRINKVISHLNYVYAFRDFGITKISKSANSVNTSNLFCCGNMIIENTITVCGNKIFFLCKDGVYSFDGSNAKKINLNISNMFEGVDNSNATSCYHNGHYYVALKLNYFDEKILGCESDENHVNNTLLKLDVDTLEFELLRGVDICSLCSIHFAVADKMIACLNSGVTNKLVELNNQGKIVDTLTTKCWKSPLSDLGYGEEIKVVRDVTLTTKYDCTVKIFSENDTKLINFVGSNAPQTIKTYLKGKKIGFEIIATSQKADISNFKMNLNLIESLKN